MSIQTMAGAEQIRATPGGPARQADRPPGRLRGFHTGAREFDDAEVRVSGRLPGWLEGSLLLNGPAIWDFPEARLQHWFDGLAMLHRFSIAPGGVRYRSRFVRSQAYLQAMASGRPVRGEFGSPNPAGFWARLRGVSPTDNPAVVMVRHGSRWIAQSETPVFTGFDADTLQTQRQVDLGAQAGIQLMAAHAMRLPDGSLVQVGVSMGRRCHYQVLRLPAGEDRAEPVAAVETPRPGYLHGFALAPGHVLVWDCALRANPLGLRFGAAAYKDQFRWHPESGSNLFAIDLHSGAVRRWSAPPLMAFHATQAWQEGQTLVVEIATYDDGRVFDDLTLERRRAGLPLRGIPQLQRYRLQPGRSEAEVQPLGIGLELQQVHPDAPGRRRADCCWGLAAPADGSFGSHVLRVDSHTLDQRSWRRDRALHLEPLFVPRPGAQADDDGVLLVPTLADDDEGGVIAVVDASTLEPLAELQAPQVLPFGFHAAFSPG